MLLLQVLAGMLVMCLAFRQGFVDARVAGVWWHDVVAAVLHLAAWLVAWASHRTGRHQGAPPPPCPAPVMPAHSSKPEAPAAKGNQQQAPDEDQANPDWLISTKVAPAAVPASPRGPHSPRAPASPRAQQDRRLARTSSININASSSQQDQRAAGGLFQRMRSSSPDDLLISVDGSGGEASRVRADQTWANDILQLLLGLPIGLMQGSELVVMSCRSSTPLGPLARVVAGVASLVFMSGGSAMLWRTIWHRRLALTTRDRVWPVYLAVLPSAHQLALQLLDQPSPFSLRVGLMLLAAGLGLMGISAKAFTAW